MPADGDAEDSPDIQLILSALCGGQPAISESDRRMADAWPQEWCLECMRKEAAALSVARMVLTALANGGRDYAAGRAAAAADIRAQADSCTAIEGGPDLMRWAAEIAEGADHAE